MFGLDEILTHSLAYAIGEDEGRAKAKKKKNNLWHTGTPTEEDWYLIQLVDHKKGGVPYQVVRWTGKWGLYFPIPNEEVVAWQRIEPYKED